jgi:hypothetical protein
MFLHFVDFVKRSLAVKEALKKDGQLVNTHFLWKIRTVFLSNKPLQ